jgi:hypothetical protein
MEANQPILNRDYRLAFVEVKSKTDQCNEVHKEKKKNHYDIYHSTKHQFLYAVSSLGVLLLSTITVWKTRTCSSSQCLQHSATEFQDQPPARITKDGTILKSWDDRTRGSQIKQLMLLTQGAPYPHVANVLGGAAKLDLAVLCVLKSASVERYHKCR